MYLQIYTLRSIYSILVKVRPGHITQTSVAGLFILIKSIKPNSTETLLECNLGNLFIEDSGSTEKNTLTHIVHRW